MSGRRQRKNNASRRAVSNSDTYIYEYRYVVMHWHYGGTDDARTSLTAQRNRQIWSNRSPPMLKKDEDVGRKIISRAATTTYMLTFQLAYKENTLLSNDDNFIRLRCYKTSKQLIRYETSVVLQFVVKHLHIFKLLSEMQLLLLHNMDVVLFLPLLVY